MENFLTIITLILGTILSIAVIIKFDIICFGWKGYLSVWTICIFVTGLIMSLFGGIIGFIFKVIWFLIKAGILIFLVTFIYSYIVGKIKKRKIS